MVSAGPREPGAWGGPTLMVSGRSAAVFALLFLQALLLQAIQAVYKVGWGNTIRYSPPRRQWFGAGTGVTFLGSFTARGIPLHSLFRRQLFGAGIGVILHTNSLSRRHRYGAGFTVCILGLCILGNIFIVTACSPVTGPMPFPPAFPVGITPGGR